MGHMTHGTKKFKAIIFDFGGVLFRYIQDPKKYYGPEGVLKIKWDMWKQSTEGKIDDSEVYKDIATRYKVEPQTVVEWLVSRREPIPQTLDLITSLKPEYKIAVINNGLKTLFREQIKKFDLDKYFDVLVNSEEEKVLKPDPKIYLSTCERLKVEPHECVFIDDNENLVVGAKALGMTGILYKSPTKLIKDLKTIGVLL